jgi:PKD repeat protein
MQASSPSRRLFRLCATACLLAGASLALSSTASASSIVSAGPLTSITISPDLNCNVLHTGDASPEWFAGTACGTLAVDQSTATLYGPLSIPAGGGASPRTAFTPISQVGPTGTGTSLDPFKIVTVAGLGVSGLTITQTDSYVVGQESYRTDVQISNSNLTSRSVRLYAAGDCYLQNSDYGYGRVDGSAIACTATSNPGSRIEQLFPLTSGSSYMEAVYSTMWSQIGAQAAGPNTCICTTLDDNAILLSWDVTVAGGGSATVSHLTTFSPLGFAPLSTTKTADSSTVGTSGPDGYTITIHNPNASAVVVNSITDTLPAGFAYVAGSTTGATTANPTSSGQTLTWNGSFSASAGGDVTLHFNVTASSTPGTYYNNAGGDAGAVVVVATGDTAPITVEAGDQPITASGTTFSATEGASFSGDVATFTDPDTAATASEYSATIDWGDGSATTAGTIGGSAGSFSVSGTHTYTEEGSYSVSVTITDVDDAGNTDTANSTATVADAALHGGTLTVPSSTSLGNPTNVSFGFSDDNTGAPASDFTATIDWGDASNSTGVIGGSGGSYAASGSHTYAAAGPYTITVTVVDDGGSTTGATAATSVVVVAPADALSAGYWKNRQAHTTSLLSIMLGGYTVGAFAEATDVFANMNCGKSSANDAAGCLGGQLLAAKLNVKNGAGTCIAPTIASADAFLISIGYTGPNATYTLTAAQRAQAIQLKDALDTYNNGLGC